MILPQNNMKFDSIIDISIPLWLGNPIKSSQSSNYLIITTLIVYKGDTKQFYIQYSEICQNQTFLGAAFMFRI